MIFIVCLKYEKNIFVKNISKNLTGKYTQRLFDSTKNSEQNKIATDELRTASKREIKNHNKATGDLTDNKIEDAGGS